MKKKPKRKSKFKIPGRSKITRQKLPNFIGNSKSFEDRKNNILDEKLKPIIPYRDPESISESEWEKIDKLDFEYFDIMRNFYNSVVPRKFQVGKDYHILRMSRSVGDPEKFGIDASTGNVMISFLGAKNVVTPDHIFELVGSLENAIVTRNNLAKDYSNQDLATPFTILAAGPVIAKFYVLVEEEPSPEFLKKDEVVVDFSDEKFLNSIDFEPGMHAIAKNNLGKEPITIKVINSSNHPDIFFYYLQLKHVMRKIDQFGVIGM